MSKQKNMVLLLLATASTIAVSRSAVAEVSSDQAARDSMAIEDIVVTATRRAANLQDVPVAITALSASDLEASGIDTAFNLTMATPGLVFGRSTLSLQPTLRGVGTTSGGPGNESPIAVYIDGVYQPDLAGNQLDLLKVDRVEVLRGPQGTLFGRNATGGLINIITPDPTFDPQAELRLRYGRFNERSVRVYGSTGISDTAAIDFAGLYSADDGYVRNLLTGGMDGDRRSFAGRSKLLLKPSDTFELRLSVNAYDIRDDSLAVGQPLNGNTNTRASNPNILLPTKPNQTSVDFISLAESEGYGANLELAFDLGGYRLETTSSFGRHKSLLIRDSDSSPAPLTTSTGRQRTETATQEIRLLSNTGDTIEWIAGVYGFYSKGTYRPLQFGATSLDPTLHTKSIAAFTDITWKVTSNFNLVGGARYTYEKRDFVQFVNGNQIFPKQKKSFDNLSPKILAQYFFSDDASVYASYSSAFKSGVFNSQATSPLAVNPEINNAFEAGVKADPLPWLRTNFAAFLYKYDDLQIGIRPPGNINTILMNAGKATMKGVEAEVTAIPVSGLQLRGAVSLLDAKYDELPNIVVQVPTTVGGVPVGGNSGLLFDASDTRMLRAPAYTISLGADYTHEFSAGAITFSANAYHSAKVRYTYDGRITQPAYWLVGGQISYELPSESVRFSIWGENLTNEHVLDTVSSTGQGDIVAYNRPRRFGVAVDFKF